MDTDVKNMEYQLTQAVEELTKSVSYLEGEINLLRSQQDRLINGSLMIYKTLESMLSHLESIDELTIKNNKCIEEIKNSAFITQLETMRQREQRKKQYDRAFSISQNE